MDRLFSEMDVIYKYTIILIRFTRCQFDFLSYDLHGPDIHMVMLIIYDEYLT